MHKVCDFYVPAQLYDAYHRDCKELTDLRKVLYPVVEALLRVRKYEPFALPLSHNPNDDYWKVITEPVDLSTIKSRIVAEEYPTASLFIQDISLVLTVGDRQGDL